MERKFQILEAVIDEYIRTGEPVGSGTIKDRLPFAVSPATIRAEMSALEAEGYLGHPHTSAGRVPTVRGYRLYIDRMGGAAVSISEEEKQKLDNFFEGLEGEGDETIIDTASHALSEITRCAIVATDTSARFSVITKVDVIPTGRRMYVLLLVTSAGDIKNRVCRLSFDLTKEQTDFFIDFVRNNLEGASPELLTPDFFEELSIALGNYVMTLAPLLKVVAELSEEMKTRRVLVKGETILIESGDIGKNQLISLLEHRNEVTELFDGAFSGISVVFGEELSGERSIVVQNGALLSGAFSKDGKPAGSLGVIGPLRLDYKKIIPYIEYFTQKVTGILSGEKEEEKDSE
ncbi:MAG: heat-inducible transcriptional repressor HrcA [Oscillospiraceae bacterium]|nr:heat-inducible transcriptional repressor HrcA [Oscillospiraceae bacterium]